MVKGSKIKQYRAFGRAQTCFLLIIKGKTKHFIGWLYLHVE